MKDQRTNLQGVSTFNWDTTYTTSFKVINEGIKHNSIAPTNFDYKEKVQLLSKNFACNLFGDSSTKMRDLFSSISDNAEVLISGKWKGWNLYLKGNGSTIYLNLDIDNGSIELTPLGKGDLSGGNIVAEVSLNIIENKDSQTKCIVMGDNPEIKVSIYQYTFPKIGKGSFWDLLINGIFSHYLNTEGVISQFKHVFATVTINDKATGDFKWLEPSDLSYAVFSPDSGATEDNSLFSMLCMTDNAKAPLNIQKSIDSQVFQGINKDANAVLCISPQKFSEHILIKTSKELFKGSSDSDFKYSTDGMEIYNVQELVMKNVEVNNGVLKDLKISAGNYTIRIMNDHLETIITNATYHESLYDVYINFNQKLRFETKQMPDNSFIFIPMKGDYYNATTHVEVEPTKTAEIMQWVGIAIDIISALTLIGGGAIKGLAKITSSSTRIAAEAETSSIVAETAVVAETAERLVQGTTKGISIANSLMIGSTVCGVIGLGLSLPSVIAEAIAKEDFSKIPTLNNFSSYLLSNLQWTGVKNTELKGARLNDAFLLDFYVNVGDDPKSPTDK